MVTLRSYYHRVTTIRGSAAARLLAASVAGALLLAACTSEPPAAPVSSAPTTAAPSGEVAAADTAAVDVKPWLAGPVPGSDASGPAFPAVWPASIVEGSGSATSRSPRLKAPEVSGEVDVEVVDLTAGGGFGFDGTGEATEVVWSGRADAKDIALPTSPPVLRQGSTYAYRVKKGDAWLGPWSFAVDEIRQGVAPTDSFGSIQVNLLSGVPATSWVSRGFARPSGTLAVGLRYRPGAPESPGLPTGWTWSLPGTGLVTLTESQIQAGSGDSAGPQSVRIATADGGGPTFVRTETGAYIPGLADGTAAQYAASGTLVRAGADRWTFTAPDGSTTEFTNGRITGEWMSGIPVAAYTWDESGKLGSVSDGIDGGQVINVSYGDGCEAGGWDGFTLPEGMLCALRYPDASTSQFGYVAAADAVQLGIAVDPGGIGVGWGWDASGRLASTRSSTVTAMAALSSDWTGREYTSEVAYDAAGRVESITEGAPAAGAPRIRHSYEYPSGSELVARVIQSTVTGGEAIPVASVLGGGAVVQVSADIANWKVSERRGVDGRSTEVTYDEQTGVIAEGTTPEGRTVVTKADDEGLMKVSVGPFLGDSSGAMRTERTLDSTIIDPSAGAASSVKAWTGLSAIVWPQDQPGLPAWWDADVLEDGLQASFNGAPGAGASPWRAQATGMWLISDSGTYDISVESSEGATAAVTVDGVRCSSAQQADECRMRLAKGEHSILVTLEVTDAQGAGSFRIKAGLGGEPRAIDIDTLRPHFSMATRLSMNDVIDGRDFGTDVLVTEEPWTGKPTEVISAGGLTTTYAYEPSTSEGLGRTTGTTTPGGSVMSASYYSMGESATDPCTSAQYLQAGLLRTITRYDGVKITTVYDAVGAPVAVTTEGDGESELVCTTYDAAGRVTSSSRRNASGDVIEEAVAQMTLANGQVTTTTTVKLGPAAPEGSGETFTSSQVTDLAGRPVEIVDASGTRARFTYSPDGTLLTRQVWAPRADASGPATLALEFEYDEQTTQPVTVKANGKVMANAVYDKRGQIVSVTYADDVALALTYDTSGGIAGVEVSAGKRTYSSQRDRNAAGRSLSSSTSVAEGQRDITDQRWTYSYDAAGRMVKAALESSGDTADTGGKKRVFEYDYGAAPEGCFQGAGANLDRVGGARDGESFAVCRDDRGRLRWTTDPHLTGGSGKAQATYDGLGRLTQLSGAVPLEIAWSGGTQVGSITQGEARTSMVIAGSALQRMTVVDGATTTVTRYGYAGSPTPVFLLDEQGEVLDMRVGLPGGVTASLDPAGEQTRLQLPDSFGAAFVTTIDGVPTGATGTGLAPRFGPFGEPLVPQRPETSAATGVGPGTVYGFQAAATNPSVVGHHDITISARPYHPWLGEFLASDPSPGASTTAYGYGDAKPVDGPDYNGAWSMWDTIGVVGAAFAVVGGVSSGYVASGSKGTFAQVAAGTAMALGSVAAIYGATMSWVEGDSSLVSSLVTVAAAAGLVFAGIGLHDWSATVTSARMAQLGDVVDSVPSLNGVSKPQSKEFMRITTGVEGFEVSLNSVNGSVERVRAVFVGPGVTETVEAMLTGSQNEIDELIVQGMNQGYVHPNAGDSLANLLGTFWNGY